MFSRLLWLMAQAAQSFFTGLLTPIVQSSLFAIGSGTSPKRLIVSLDGNNVYAGSNVIYQYRIDSATKTLASLNPATLGVAAQSWCQSSDGAFVYVASGASTLSIYPRNTTTGVLGTATASPTGTQMAGVAISTDGAYVMACDFGANLVRVFSRNSGTGALSASSTKAVTSPTYCIVSPDNNYFYAISGTIVYQFSRNTGTGVLTALSPASITPANGGIAAICIAPDGQSVYTAHSTTGYIYPFSRNTGTGLLTIGTVVSTGAPSYDILVSPDNNNVYASSNGSYILQYSRNPGTSVIAALTPATVTTSAGAEYINISPDGYTIYVNTITAGSGRVVNGLSRDPGTGLLTAINQYATYAASTTPLGLLLSPNNTCLYAMNSGTTTVSSFYRNTKDDYLTAFIPTTVTSATGASGACISPDGTSVYVANTNSTLEFFVRSTTTGVLTPTTSYPIGTGAKDTIISPDGLYVYSSDQGTNTNTVYSRNPGTGALSLASTFTSAAGPAGMAMSSDGLFVYIAVSGTGIMICSRDTGTGALTNLSTTSAAGAFELVISPDGNYLYATGGTSNVVYQFSRNSGTGALTPLSPASVAAGSTTQYISITADGTSVYATNNLTGTVSQYSRNTGTGLLTNIGTANCGITAAGIVITSNGKYVYVAASNNSYIVSYNRNTSTGMLTLATAQVTQFGSPGLAYSEAISPDGTSVYYGLGTSIASYKRNTANGLLTSTGSLSLGTNYTYAICFSPDGLYGYAASSGYNGVYQFSRNPSTGVLTALSPAQAPASSGTTPQDITISPDGAYVYVELFSSGGGGIGIFSRDPSTGLLTWISQYAAAVTSVNMAPSGNFIYGAKLVSAFGINSCARNPGTGLITAMSNYLSAATAYTTPAFSSDGKYAYLILFGGGDGKIYQASIDTTTGALSYLTPSYVVGPGSMYDIDISPDGGSVYVFASPAGTNDQIFQYSRNKTNGQLSLLQPPSVIAGIQGTVGGHSLQITPDSRHLYYYSFSSNNVGGYIRN